METFKVKVINRGLIIDNQNLNNEEIKTLIKKYNNSYLINWYRSHGHLDSGYFDDIFFKYGNVLYC